MAARASARRSKEEAAPRACWIPMPASQPHLQMADERTVVHLRACGAMDAAHGTHRLGAGTHRVHYLVRVFEDDAATLARSPMLRGARPDGVVLGVCDASALEADLRSARRARGMIRNALTSSPAGENLPRSP